MSTETVLVTGATRGIGAGIARRLGREGATVAINGRTPVAVDHAVRELAAEGIAAVPAVADVGERDAVERMFEAILERCGPIDAIVNNAALSNSAALCHFLDTDQSVWDAVIRTNLTGVYNCSHIFANWLVDAGRDGIIVNISSFGAQRAHRCMAAYDACKGAIDSLTRAMAVDLAPFGIRVNAVAPGAIDVEEHLALPPERRATRARPIPLARAGTPDDIGAAVAFLIGPDASYITGQTLVVDGGVLAQLRTPDVDVPMPTSLVDRMAARHPESRVAPR
jgi:3-oxoacyl-[acyl-carrier protein] reductase